jgi:hypothetical protein
MHEIIVMVFNINQIFITFYQQTYAVNIATNVAYLYGLPALKQCGD